jgi:hypothetical protein
MQISLQAVAILSLISGNAIHGWRHVRDIYDHMETRLYYRMESAPQT